MGIYELVFLYLTMLRWDSAARNIITNAVDFKDATITACPASRNSVSVSFIKLRSCNDHDNNLCQVMPGKNLITASANIKIDQLANLHSIITWVLRFQSLLF